VVHLSNLCTEILEVTSNGETAVCNLGSINLGRHLSAEGKFDFDKLRNTVRLAVRQLDKVIDLNFYPIATAEASNLKWRPVGLGVMGLQDVFFQLRLPFDGLKARELSQAIQEEIYYSALSTSCELAAEKEPHPSFSITRAARGELQFDSWGIVPSNKARWDELRERIKSVGLRNSLLLAIAPTATIASIAGCYECIEPQVSNLFKRETLSGDFLQVNRYLVTELKNLGMWDDSMRNKLKVSEGSVQEITELPAELREIYRTAWEIPMRALIDMAAERGAFIDQSQSLNLFMESPTIGKLSSMYFHAWKRGLKTTYYLRSRPATRIAKATVESTNSTSFNPEPPPRPAAQAAPASPAAEVQANAPAPGSDAAAIACSLENPESCEACQ
jgi:ribonucleoside-diphosphate reductase alpha chain